MEKESVWDYPRPPRLEPTTRRIRVVERGVTIADSVRAFRILETSHPPVYYVPPADVALLYLNRIAGKSSYCEYKGRSAYWNVKVPAGADQAASIVQAGAWSYDNPASPFERLRDHLAFYASKMDECWVDDERVVPQPGDFYGGWITQDLIGPFKGTPGTMGW